MAEPARASTKDHDVPHGAVLRLRDQADDAGVSVTCANNNDGERSRRMERCAAGADGVLTRRLAPRPGVRRLVLTGLAADNCVLFTAADARLRGYGPWVPGDAVAGRSPQRTRCALDIMETIMGAGIRFSSELPASGWVRAA